MSFLRSNSKRSDGLDYTLIKGGRTHLLWRVSKDGKDIRFEVWHTFRGAFGKEDYYEIGHFGSDSASFSSQTGAENYFNDKELNY
jgi:hypothetical protein